MDSWYKKAEELAAAAKAKAEELKEGAEALSSAFDISGLETKATELPPGHKDVEFPTSQMGFRMEGTMVVHVEPEGHAERLEIAVGDRLVKVAGYDIPEFEFGDLEAEERAENAAKKMLREMPPPVRLGFAPPPVLDMKNEDEDIDEEADIDVPSTQTEASIDSQSVVPTQLPAPSAEMSSAGDGAATAVAAAGEDLARSVSPELVTSVTSASLLTRTASGTSVAGAGTQGNDEKSKQVTKELREARQARAILTGNLEAQKKQSSLHERRATELAEELEIYKAQSAELLLSASRGEADSDAARDAWEARQKALEGQVRSLEEALAAAKASAKTGAEESAKESAAAASAAEAQASAAEARAAELVEKASEQKSAIDSLHDELRACEARAVAAEQRFDVMDRGRDGFRNAHEAELDLFKEEQGRLQRKVAELEEKEARSRAEERETLIELGRLRFETEEARKSEALQRAAAESVVVDVQAAAVEANAARKAAAEAEERLAAFERQRAVEAERVERAEERAARAAIGEAEGKEEAASDDEDVSAELPAAALDNSRYAGAPVRGGADTSALHARIELLQARCSALQEKLIAQRTVGSQVRGAAQPAGAGQRIPVWLPYVTQAAGPRVGQVSVLVFRAVDQVLRGFTQRLLARDMWLWMFYAHLIFLYTIAGSIFAQATPDPNSPINAINAHLRSQQAGGHTKIAVAGAPGT